MCVFFFRYFKFVFSFFFIFHFLGQGFIFPFFLPDGPFAGPPLRQTPSAGPPPLDLPLQDSPLQDPPLPKTPAAFGGRQGFTRCPENSEFVCCEYIFNDEIAQRPPQFHERPRKLEKKRGSGGEKKKREMVAPTWSASHQDRPHPDRPPPRPHPPRPPSHPDRPPTGTVLI